jgi:hypothetical protein
MSTRDVTSGARTESYVSSPAAAIDEIRKWLELFVTPS